MRGIVWVYCLGVNTDPQSFFDQPLQRRVVMARNLPKLFVLLIALLGLMTPNKALAQDARKADHEALRELMKKATEAFNAKKFDELKGLLDEKNFAVITIDNQKFKTIDDFAKYSKGLYEGPKAVLNDVKFAPEADELTEFLAADVGVVHGHSKDTYTFKDGDVRVMETAWTAVVRKTNGQWKIVKVHFSSNLFKNPLLDAAVKKIQTIAAASGIGGLALGLIVMGLMRRKSA